MADIFTHINQIEVHGGQERTLLVSTPNINNLTAQYPERLLLMVLLGTGNQMYIYDSDDVYRVLLAHRDYVKVQNFHCGDCTQMAASCLLCLAESMYEDVIDFENDAQIAGVTMDLATLILGTEHECDTYQTLSDYYSQHDTFKGYVAQDTSVSARLIIWNNLTEEQKKSAAERAAKYRHWLQVKLPDMPASLAECWI